MTTPHHTEKAAGRFLHNDTFLKPRIAPHLEFVEAVPEGCDVVVPVPAHQLTQRTDQLFYMLTFSSSCSTHMSPRGWLSTRGSMSRWPVNGFLLGWVALRHSSQYDTSQVTQVFTASWGGSCSQN
ncbi:hypothetical protein EYF80_022698 [Liparis tanakae]|uniref:Uncharacterized protein n=1 Tax=Liparis tanakae TaxID=230148 RepID=A0A4Z2HQJ5_9TELE|nr:hypothetical protein EYF80_022698 [Liparis tanakae]